MIKIKHINENDYARIFVFGDMHGCLGLFNLMIKKINLTKNTVKQNNFSGSVIAALSDENLNKDKDLSGYALNVKNLDFLSVKIKPRILAAGAYSSNVSQNTLNLSDSVNGTNVEARGGHSYKGAAQNNKVNITASKIDAVLGGSSRNGKANSNKVVIKSNGQTASEVRVAHGGRTWFSKNGAHNNEVTVKRFLGLRRRVARRRHNLKQGRRNVRR